MQGRLTLSNFRIRIMNPCKVNDLIRRQLRINPGMLFPQGASADYGNAQFSGVRGSAQIRHGAG